MVIYINIILFLITYYIHTIHQYNHYNVIHYISPTTTNKELIIYIVIGVVLSVCLICLCIIWFIFTVIKTRKLDIKIKKDCKKDGLKESLLNDDGYHYATI